MLLGWRCVFSIVSGGASFIPFKLTLTESSGCFRKANWFLQQKLNRIKLNNSIKIILIWKLNCFPNQIIKLIALVGKSLHRDQTVSSKSQFDLEIQSNCLWTGTLNQIVTQTQHYRQKMCVTSCQRKLTPLNRGSSSKSQPVAGLRLVQKGACKSNCFTEKNFSGYV